MKRAILVAALVVPCALALTAAHAGEVTGLVTFTAGTPARAAEVNGNFNAVKTAVDDNHARINTLQSGATGLETRVTALENAGDEFGPLMFGDGSAGDLVVSSDVVWAGAGAPTNLSFNNVTIQSGAVLTVVGGTTMRCSGSFTNNGTIVVVGLTRGGLVDIPNAGVRGTRFNYPHVGDTADGPSLAAYDSDGAFSVIDGGFGGSGMARTYVTSNLSSLRFGGAAGGGTAGQSGGFGGGVFKVLCNNGVSNSGMITADGQPGSGGGGGGIIVLASRTSVSNTGTIAARGGSGDHSSSTVGAGGGGGGGFIVMIAPTVANSGTTNVAGGTGGNATTAVTNAPWRAGGGAGGGSGGNGGNGGSVTGTTSEPGQAGDAGLVLTLQNDPLFLVR